MYAPKHFGSAVAVRSGQRVGGTETVAAAGLGSGADGNRQPFGLSKQLARQRMGRCTDVTLGKWLVRDISSGPTLVVVAGAGRCAGAGVGPCISRERKFYSWTRA